jgi:tetratricopeptide (TPR) repeat protein
VAPVRELLPSIEQNTQKALELDPFLAEAYVALGLRRALEHDLKSAEEAFRRAIELNPDLPDAYDRLARHCLAPMGKLDQAVEEAKKALQVDPLSTVTAMSVGASYYQARCYDEAIPYLRIAVELDPSHWRPHFYLGFTYVQKQMYAEAHREFAQVTTETCPVCPPGGALGTPFVLAALGEREQALKALGDLGFSGHYPELTYTALGEKDLAFQWLEKNIEQELSGGLFSVMRLYLKVDPIWDPLRDDPRFPEMLRRLKLEP